MYTCCSRFLDNLGQHLNKAVKGSIRPPCWLVAWRKEREHVVEKQGEGKLQGTQGQRLQPIQPSAVVLLTRATRTAEMLICSGLEEQFDSGACFGVHPNRIFNRTGYILRHMHWDA